MKILDSSTIENIIWRFETEAFHAGYQLSTKITQEPRYILDVVFVLQFKKGKELITVSMLGEVDDDFVMLIVAEGEKLENRRTLFRTVDSLKSKLVLSTEMAA